MRWVYAVNPTRETYKGEPPPMNIRIQNFGLVLLTVLLTLLTTLTLSACSEDDSSGSSGSSRGTLQVLLGAEEVILEGLTPGDDAENIRDGWSVTFDKYIVTVGHIDIHLATDDSVEQEADDVYVVDLTEVPAAGLALWEIGGLQAGRWAFNYETAGAGDGSTRHESVTEADYTMMTSNDWTYYIDGTLSQQNGGQSCPPTIRATVPADKTPNSNTSGTDACYDAATVGFAFGAPAETTFGPCEIDGVAGFAITGGRTTTVTATIHGDHPFFNGFPEGDESGTMRLVQWLADSDLNLDGEVTAEELEMIGLADLPVIADYQLGGSSLESASSNMYDYLVAQLQTQGHFQGEGECPVDGVAHDHGDE